MSIKQRVRDTVHEWEIARLKNGYREACTARDKAKARLFLSALAEAVSRRSPEQIVRMERAKGLR